MENFKLAHVSGIIAPAVAAQLLDPLNLLTGTWKGTGFNQIWRPAQAQDRFLELNETIETLTLTDIGNNIANRGLLTQPDIVLHGLSYTQQIADANVKTNGQPTGIHFEPGLWLNIPASAINPVNPITIARLASIPHGTTLTAQGTFTTINTSPVIPSVSIKPFPVGGGAPLDFPEQTLATPTIFRTRATDIPHVTQAMVDNPNSFLARGLVLPVGQAIVSTTILNISTNIAKVHPPATGGGTSNISFLQGNTANGSNANAMSVEVDATFWIETIKDTHGVIKMQLQYSQTVLLNFNGLSWPHVSVATLQK